jgi:shikimate dehydrogenase
MTELVVLIGEGIGYSASPAIHNAAFAALGMPWRYELRDVVADALPATMADLRTGVLRGANITRPHKVRALEFTDELAESADRVGAVNTIVVRDGRLVGHDTDLPAIAEQIGLLEQARRADAPRFASAVILGRGGAARAVAAVLADAGASVELVGRERWADLPALLESADLLVNATPVGTATDESPVDAALLRPDLAVLDLVYRPSPTRLVREARARWALARDGAGVLLRQAALSFELWTGGAAPVGAMRRGLEAELGVATDA